MGTFLVKHSTRKGRAWVQSPHPLPMAATYRVGRYN